MSQAGFLCHRRLVRRIQIKRSAFGVCVGRPGFSVNGRADFFFNCCERRERRTGDKEARPSPSTQQNRLSVDRTRTGRKDIGTAWVSPPGGDRAGTRPCPAERLKKKRVTGVCPAEVERVTHFIVRARRLGVPGHNKGGAWTITEAGPTSCKACDGPWRGGAGGGWA